MGRQSDGGWEVCNDKEFKPRTPCLVYSFGILHEYSFDDDVAATYNCEVHSFDPSDGREDYRHAPMVWFHNTGISDFNGYLKVNNKQWKMRRLETIRNELGHENRNIDILKIDVEKSEWKALPDIISSGILHNVTQLLFECHIGKIQDEDESYKDFLTVLRIIYEHGFRIFWNRKGTCLYHSKISGKLRTACQEIFTVKVHQT
ncbi:hypothetical protein KUTeg_018553 [Tegillarca granosa]|uniref:Methyltransferase domain-containing protein n=1 Tax=Tegillarca granosa TaxID=220873 RepID=A0ABQ9EIF9_TEGGR|nr:hypothetical protein KUTeg_018553 [Tegillarca granosa]